MFKSIRNLLVAGILAISVAATSFAGVTSQFPHREIENWRNQGMMFVVRDAQGHIMHHAKGHLEKWRSEQYQVWVVRDAQGRFLTFMRGTLERWADGSLRLVLRNHDGKFVAVGLVRYIGGRPVIMSVEMVEQMLEAA